MNELIVRIFTSFLLIFILYFSYINNLVFHFLLISIFILSIIEYSFLIFKIKKKKIESYSYVALGIIYLLIIFNFLIFKIDEIKDIIFYFIIVCIATDIGGLLFGKVFKGKKLTKISPKKTFAGFYGSFIMSFLFMFLLIDNLNINIFTLIIFTFSVCMLSQFGDLFFSYLKRRAKVKDSGNLLPGHGGILDRVDGMIISVPINIFFYTLAL
tara:strand:- start:4339 stop:4974 length:636 start_codon:yes stop_codon:yes gene_type:complete